MSRQRPKLMSRIGGAFRRIAKPWIRHDVLGPPEPEHTPDPTWLTKPTRSNYYTARQWELVKKRRAMARESRRRNR